MPLPTSITLKVSKPGGDGEPDIDPNRFLVDFHVETIPVEGTEGDSLPVGHTRSFEMKRGQDGDFGETVVSDSGSNIISSQGGTVDSSSQVTFPSTQSPGIRVNLVSGIITAGYLKKTTEYFFRVREYLAGAFRESNTLGVKFSDAADTVRPSVTGVTKSVSNSTATISWTVNDPNCTNTVEYGLTTAYGTRVTASSGLHPSVTITGLPANQHNFFRVKSLDAAGNAGVATGDFTTSPSSTISTLNWAKIATTTNGSVVALGTAVDSAGNVYTVGWFRGVVNFGGGWTFTSFTGNAVADCFFSKHDSSGVIQWVRRMGSTDNDTAYAVAVDHQDNPIVTGSFRATIDLGGVSLTTRGASSSANNIFVAKYGPGSLGSPGTLTWAKQFGKDNESPTGIAVDSANDIAVLGRITSLTSEFGPDINGNPVTLSRTGNQSIAVFKLRGTDGVTIWGKSRGGTGFNTPSGIAVDNINDILICGNFSTATDLGNGSITCIGGTDIFMAKYYGLDGSYSWGKRVGNSTTSTENAIGIATHPVSNAVVITGSFNGIGDFGGGPVDIGSGGFFIAGYDSGGNFMWVKASGTSSDYGAAVAIDSSGNLVATGKTKAGIDFGPGTASLGATGQDNYWVAAFTMSGSASPTWRWTRLAGAAHGHQPASSALSYGKGIALAPGGRVVTCGGIYQGTAYFDDTTSLTSPYFDSAFTAQYVV